MRTSVHLDLTNWLPGSNSCVCYEAGTIWRKRMYICCIVVVLGVQVSVYLTVYVSSMEKSLKIFNFINIRD